MVAATLAVSFLLGQQKLSIPPPLTRFEYGAPLPALPAEMLDTYQDGMGIAQQTARAKHLQGRILWIDGTANLDKVASDELVRSLMKQIASVGFNTIVFDIKPISGQVLYASKIAPKITEWKGKKLPIDYDPLPAVLREGKAYGLKVLISMNAFSEGHSLFKVGPGYETPEHQTVVYVSKSMVSGWRSNYSLNPKLNTEGPGVSVYTESVNIEPDSGKFAVSVDSKGVVRDGFFAGGLGNGTPTVPSGGAVLVGTGDAAKFLRDNAEPGRRLEFYTEAEFAPISEHPELQYPLMMNPNDPWVQERALSIVDEVIAKYDVDGVLYDDRLRYAGMYADFSPSTRAAFEKYVNAPGGMRWPDDVFRYTLNSRLVRGVAPGKYYNAWMTWRSLQMRNWVASVRAKVKAKRPNALFGVYGGSWFGDYHALGTNYASPDVEAGFWFMTNRYQQTGFAPLLDLLITGCYYTVPTIYDAMTRARPIGPTVEAAGQLSNALANDQCWTYAGIQLSDFKGDPDGLGRVLQAACASTQGVMVFDLSHDIEPMWPVFKRAFSLPASPPHAYPTLLKHVREIRAKYDGMGAKARPVPINNGASGTGF